MEGQFDIINMHNFGRLPGQPEEDAKQCKARLGDKLVALDIVLSFLLPCENCGVVP